VQRVLSEDRGIKHEAIAIVDLIREVAKYPYPTPEETFQRISLLCRALRALLAQGD
jgi:hypothetical protein